MIRVNHGIGGEITRHFLNLPPSRARTIQIHHLKRNSRDSGDYSPRTTQHKSQQRRQHAKQPWKLLHAALKDYILDKLNQHWSPVQIEGRLFIDYPDDVVMRIYNETIYEWVYPLKKECSDLYKKLHFINKQRRTRRDAKNKRGQITARKLINARPVEVE